MRSAVRAIPLLAGWGVLWGWGDSLEATSAFGRHGVKLAEMFLALVTIQTLGSALRERLGPTAGAGTAAFIGGLISSTATTAAIARRSGRGSGTEVLEYLASLSAMLIESLAIVTVGAGAFAGNAWFLFGLPLALSIYGAIAASRTAHAAPPRPAASTNPYASALRLALVLVLLTAATHYGLRALGNVGLYGVTLAASFFEAHAVTIANANLRAANAVTDRQFADLIALSVAGSLASKALLVATFGRRVFARRTLPWTTGAVFAVGVAWAIGRAA